MNNDSTLPKLDQTYTVFTKSDNGNPLARVVHSSGLVCENAETPDARTNEIICKNALQKIVGGVSL